MLNELEDFLRRAAQRAMEQQKQQVGPQPQPPPRPAQRPTPARLVPQAEVLDAELVDQPNRVSQSVQRNLRSTQQIGQHANQLGERIGQSDENLESHLHKAFDHRLGRLHSTDSQTLPEAAPENTDTVAASTKQAMHPIAQLLANPQSIRNAVMLREILDRPTGRWD